MPPATVLFFRPRQIDICLEQNEGSMTKQTASLHYLHPHKMEMAISDTDTLSIALSVSKHLKQSAIIMVSEGALLF